MCLCWNASFGRPTCSQTITCSFSKSLVAPSRGNCGGHFFAVRSACAPAILDTPIRVARTMMPARASARRRLNHFTIHLRQARGNARRTSDGAAEFGFLLGNCRILWLRPYNTTSSSKSRPLGTRLPYGTLVSRPAAWPLKYIHDVVRGSSLFLAAYACSGLAGLIYEVVWVRDAHALHGAHHSCDQHGGRRVHGWDGGGLGDRRPGRGPSVGPARRSSDTRSSRQSSSCRQSHCPPSSRR